jgi:hypothetical protein
VATTLAPGESLAVADIGAGTSNPGVLSEEFGQPFFYEQAPTGAIRNLQYYNTFEGMVTQDERGNAEVMYTFGAPEFGLHPTLPGDPVRHVDLLPADAVISVAGFRSGLVDVSVISNPIKLMSVETISRSSDGNVISFTGFSGRDVGLNPLTDGFAFQVDGVAFGDSSATASLVDAEGLNRTLTVDVVGPVGGAGVPEPATGLFGAAVIGMVLRQRRWG